MKLGDSRGEVKSARNKRGGHASTQKGTENTQKGFRQVYSRLSSRVADYLVPLSLSLKFSTIFRNSLPFPSRPFSRPPYQPLYNSRPIERLDSVVSRSRREARKAHFGAASDERRVRMAAPLSKSLKAEHGVSLHNAGTRGGKKTGD